MTMTASQDRYLRNLLAHRNRPPTIGSIFRAGVRSHLVLFLLFAALGAFISPAFGWTGAAFLATSFFSVLLRDLSHFRSAVRLWPVTHEIVDWPRVEHLVEANEAPPPPP